MSRFVVFVQALVLALSLPASSQTQYSSSPGLFASGDIYGSQNRFMSEDKAFGYSFGARIEINEVRSHDVALRVERIRGWFPDPGPALPPETFYGIEFGTTWQRDARTVTRAAATGGALVADAGGVRYPEGGGFEFTRGRTAVGAMLHANVIRHRQIGNGLIYILPGVGLYGEAERRFPQTAVFNAGSQDEQVTRSPGATHLTGGVLLILPVVFVPRSDHLLVLEPVLKVDVPELIFSGRLLPYLNARLNL